MVLILVSLVKVRVLIGAWPQPTDTAFQLAFIVPALIGAWTRREWYHKLQAPLAVIGVIAYIITLFTHLQ